MPPDHGIWQRVVVLHEDHQKILPTIEVDYGKFPELDARFHRLLNEASQNRFISDFQDLISIIFHFHYRWNKGDEMERNKIAAVEHLACLDALIARDTEAAYRALVVHLATAQRSLATAVDW
ncbi:MAG: FCD domain-containing protein [Alphaproteobacteria bacterium]